MFTPRDFQKEGLTRRGSAESRVVVEGEKLFQLTEKIKHMSDIVNDMIIEGYNTPVVPEVGYSAYQPVTEYSAPTGYRYNYVEDNYSKLDRSRQLVEEVVTSPNLPKWGYAEVKPALRYPNPDYVDTYGMRILLDIFNAVAVTLKGYSDSIILNHGVRDYSDIAHSLVLELSADVFLLEVNGNFVIHFNVKGGTPIDSSRGKEIYNAVFNVCCFGAYIAKLLTTPFSPTMRLDTRDNEIVLRLTSNNLEEFIIPVGALILIKHKLEELGWNSTKTIKVLTFDVRIDNTTFTIQNRKSGAGYTFSNELLSAPVVNNVTIDKVSYKRYQGASDALTLKSLIVMYNDWVGENSNYALNKEDLKLIDVYARTQFMSSILYEEC